MTINTLYDYFNIGINGKPFKFEYLWFNLKKETIWIYAFNNDSFNLYEYNISDNTISENQADIDDDFLYFEDYKPLDEKDDIKVKEFILGDFKRVFNELKSRHIKRLQKNGQKI